jgi:pentatricopeptide repeat protein
LITYNSLLDGLVKAGQLEEADRIFSELVDSHIRPDLITFSTLLKGHCKRGNIAKVNQYVQTIMQCQISPDESLL